jgi:hypothetical protein
MKDHLSACSGAKTLDDGCRYQVITLGYPVSSRSAIRRERGRFSERRICEQPSGHEVL